MPNVDFERERLARQVALPLDSQDFASGLLSQKALIDAPGEEIITLNFMDTLRPELWCVEGLARHLNPGTGRHYGLELIEGLPVVEARVKADGAHTLWALYVQVEPEQAIADDGYFFKKVRDQLGFGSPRQIDVTILPGMQRDIVVDVRSDDAGDLLPELPLSPGMNTVVVSALDPRIATWLFFDFACNYLDRGYVLRGYATTADRKKQFALWDVFTIDDSYVRETYGFAPEPRRFEQVLRDQHFDVRYEPTTQQWHVTPPIFRFDIIHPIDILEEYLVVTHYEKVRPVPLWEPPGMGSRTRRSALEERLAGFMQAYGARQTIGLLLDSFENIVEHTGGDEEHAARLIRLQNAVNINREYLVDSSLPPLLRNAVHASAPLPPATFYLFTETASLDAQQVAHSRWKMGILLVGSEHPFNNAHTLLDALCHHLRLPYTLRRGSSPALIAGRHMMVYAGDEVIGQFGEVHPETLVNWELFYPASFVELDPGAIERLWR
jgi:hypothetical protein